MIDVCLIAFHDINLVSKNTYVLNKITVARKPPLFLLVIFLFSGDLTSNVSDTGIGELHTKRVAKQLSAALEHLHTRDLVHRDVKLDNIIVFKSDFSRIKLCDFGETRRVGTVVMRRNEWLPYAPPEVLQVTTDGSYMLVPQSLTKKTFLTHSN